MVLGFILLIILDLSFGFWSYFLAKQALKIFSNQQLLEYWPPKNHQFRGQKRYEGQKNSLGHPKNLKNGLFELQKMRKMIFFKKPEFWDLTEHWGWFPQWPWWPGQCRTSWFNSLNPNLALDPCVSYTNHQVYRQMFLRESLWDPHLILNIMIFWGIW